MYPSLWRSSLVVMLISAQVMGDLERFKRKFVCSKLTLSDLVHNAVCPCIDQEYDRLKCKDVLNGKKWKSINQCTIHEQHCNNIDLNEGQRMVQCCKRLACYKIKTLC